MAHACVMLAILPVVAAPISAAPTQAMVDTMSACKVID
jgi:hypothetical protein